MKARGGFTLIEVLLAAIILGLGLTGILVSMSQAQRFMQTMPDLLTAQEVMDMGDMAYPLSEINKACDAADNMSYAFDNAYTSLRDPKTSDFRTQDAKIADEMAMRAGANMRILMDTINDIKIKQ